MATTTATVTSTASDFDRGHTASGIIENIVLDTDSSSGGSFNGAHHFEIHDGTFVDVSGRVEQFNVDIHYDKVQGLNLLYPAISSSALFDSSERCSLSNIDLPEIHRGLLARLHQWIEDSQPQHRILLVSGPTRTGKSLLAQILAEHYQSGESLKDNGTRFAAASFLFPTGTDGTIKPNYIIPTLAYQFAYSNPSIVGDIVRPVQEDQSILDRNMSTQLKRLVIAPLERDKSTRRFSVSTPIPIIIDGLDTWAAGYEKQKELIDVVKKAVSGNLPFRFVIFTRMEGKLKGILKGDDVQAISDSVEMDDVYRSAIDMQMNGAHGDSVEKDDKNRCAADNRSKSIRARVGERWDNRKIVQNTKAKIVAVRGFMG